MSWSGMIVVAACSALVGGSVAGTQRHAASSSDDKAGVNVALRVDGAAYDFKGRGPCINIPNVTVVGVSGQNWQVAHNEPERDLILSFLRPSNGAGDMFSLRVRTGGKQYVTNTIVLSRGVVKGATEGSGKVTLEPAATGGTFTIDATAVNGAKITGTITCDAFTPGVAVGGE